MEIFCNIVTRDAPMYRPLLFIGRFLIILKPSAYWKYDLLINCMETMSSMSVA